MDRLDWKSKQQFRYLHQPTHQTKNSVIFWIFPKPGPISDHVYHVSLDYLEIEDTPGTKHIDDGILYEAADAYGLKDASDIYIYTPGAPVVDIPEACLSWMIGRADGEYLENTFVLYNVYGEYAFVSE